MLIHHVANVLLIASRSIEFGLHITKEHGTTPDDAIATYFDGVANHDAEHRRFVTMTAIHTLFWNWIEQGSSVYVISCIRAGE
jgi:hypothetical protein